MRRDVGHIAVETAVASASAPATDPLAAPLRWVEAPSSGFFCLGKTGLSFAATDPGTAETLAKDARAASRLGLRSYIATRIKPHEHLLLRFVEDGMRFEYQIEDKRPDDSGTLVTVSVWFEPARVVWDVMESATGTVADLDA